MLVIIQARSSSQIFKGKILKIIYGKPLINHVISRVQKVTKVIVATSKNKSYDKLVEYLKKNKKIYL